MHRLKSKASRFFKDADAPNQTENAAHAPAECETEFDAGIERGVRKKPSRFFQARSEKQHPRPSADTSLFGGVSRGRPDVSAREGEARGVVVNDTTDSMVVKTSKRLPPTPVEQDAPVPALKSRPSFKSLRSSSSRIFRSKPRTHSPPPPTPPLPQLSTTPTTPGPKLRRPTLRPPEFPRCSKSGSTSKLSISRPISQDAALPAPVFPSILPFTKPAGPPPPRPPRPETVDVELVRMRRSAGTSVVLHMPPDARCSTITNSTTTTSTTTTTPTTTSTPTRSNPRTLSNPASTSPRLDLPSRPTTHPPSILHPSPFTPPTTANRTALSAGVPFPLAARIDRSRPLPSSLPLPFGGGMGRVRSYGFAAWVEARGYYCGGAGNCNAGSVNDWNIPIEAFDHSGADWIVERRVSNGPGGARGMLWRERGGAWCFVPDL